MGAVDACVRCFVMVVLAAPAMVSAQPLDPRVEALVREGIAHRVAGRDEAAIAPLEAAYAAQRAPVTAGQLALACQAVGRWTDADRYMREALASPDDDWVRRHRRELDEAYAIVRRNVGDLELRGGPVGAQVSIDGVASAQLPLGAPLRLRAGVATVEVRAAGHFPFTRQVTILGGELTREPVSLTPLPREVPTTPTPPPLPTMPPPTAPVVAVRVSRRVPTATWILGGSGAALVVGGVVSLALREASAARFNGNSECVQPAVVPRAGQAATCQDELAIGDCTTATTVVGFAGGAVLLGVGVLLAVLPRRESSAPLAWRCLPTLTGASCAWSF